MKGSQTELTFPYAWTPYQAYGLNRRDLTIFASPILKTGVQAFIQNILLSCEVGVLIGHPSTETKPRLEFVVHVHT